MVKIIIKIYYERDLELYIDIIFIYNQLACLVIHYKQKYPEMFDATEIFYDILLLLLVL